LNSSEAKVDILARCLGYLLGELHDRKILEREQVEAFIEEVDLALRGVDALFNSKNLELDNNNLKDVK
jgi:hypothetical protein